MSCASEVMLKWREMGAVAPAAREDAMVLFITGMRSGKFLSWSVDLGKLYRS
jgi:hypothetical protein